jgi:predicted nuclease of predicted toxin-antitoxin system
LRWLIDEMLPATAAAELVALGHEALSVAEAGLAGASDDVLYDLAVKENRVLVSENFADFATIVKERVARNEPCAPVVFVRKQDFPRRGALAPRLAQHLHEWAVDNPDPFPGVHWP